jgi:hypothetical protein
LTPEQGKIAPHCPQEGQGVETSEKVFGTVVTAFLVDFLETFLVAV